jgi:hypothetical protein
MKKMIVILLIVVVGVFTLVACGPFFSQTAQPQNIGTPFPTGDDPMKMVEMFATETAVARTQEAESGFSSVTATAAFSLVEELRSTQLAIILPDGSRHGFTYEKITEYATLTLDLFDKPRKAVDMRFLLDQVNWSEYSPYSITLEGKNSVVFRVVDLPEDSALYLLEDGTLNFVSGEIPAEEWPYDIIQIIIH